MMDTVGSRKNLKCALLVLKEFMVLVPDLPPGRRQP